MEPEKNKLDQWLDLALRDYGHSEPRLGLETRIFANLAAEKNMVAIRTLWPWGFASVAVVLMVVVVIWSWMSTQKTHAPSGNFANNNTTLQQKELVVSTKSNVQAPKPMTAKREVRRPLTKAPELAKSPRLSQFPSVRELNTQEQLLARYARDFPQRALEVAQAQAAAEEERIRGELVAE